MNKFIETLKNIWKIEELRNRILFTLAIGLGGLIWYFAYARKRVVRHGAIFHCHWQPSWAEVVSICFFIRLFFLYARPLFLVTQHVIRTDVFFFRDAATCAFVNAGRWAPEM